MTNRDAEGIIACSRSVERSDTTGYRNRKFHIPAGMAAIEQTFKKTLQRLTPGEAQNEYEEFW